MAVRVFGANAGDDYTDVEDIRIAMAQNATNYEGSYLEVSKWEATLDEVDSILNIKQLGTVLAGRTIVSGFLRIYRENGNGATYTIDIRRLLVDVVEAEATWNNRANATPFNQAGCRGDGTDRVAVPIGTISVDPTNGYKISTDLRAYLQDVADGNITNFLFDLERNGIGDDEFHRFTSAEGTDGQRWTLTVEWEDAPSNSVTVTDTQIAYGATGNYTSTGLGPRTSWQLEDSAGNTISVTGDQNTFNPPNLASGANRILTGPVYLIVGDGTNTVKSSNTFVLNPPANYSSVVLESGFDTSVNSFLFNYSGTPAVGDEFLFVTNEVTLFPNGNFTMPSAGTSTFYGIDATDGLMESAQVTWADTSLSGTSSSSSSSTAILDTQIELLGASLSTSSSSSDLSSGIELAGASSSVSLSNGALFTTINLTGVDLGSSSADGMLSAQITLSGNSISNALSTADLTAESSGLSGSSVSNSSASGSLDTDITLGATSTAVSTSSGMLLANIQLSAISSSISSATGNLILDVEFSGSSISNSMAVADLTTTIQLNAQSISTAIAQGLLTDSDLERLNFDLALHSTSATKIWHSV